MLDNPRALALPDRRCGLRGHRALSISATVGRYLSLASLAAGLMLVTGGVSLAGPSDVSSALRSRAISICTNDALRLCPEALFDEGRAVTCMTQHRRQLSRPCSVVYDQVARALRR